MFREYVEVVRLAPHARAESPGLLERRSLDGLEREGKTYKKHWGKWGVVPIRVLVYEDYAGEDGPPERADVIPSDIYYTDLDINWNPDGDDYFGEPGEIPAFKPDVACGWIPATTATELSGWLGKLLKYEKNPNLEKIGDDTYLHRALHILTDAGLDPRCKERGLFADHYVPEGFFTKNMWEGGGVLPSWPLQSWPTYPEPYQVSYEVNQGYGLITMETHGNPYYFDLITRGNNAGTIQCWASDQIQKSRRVHRTIYPSTVNELYSENERYGIMYSGACNGNDFTYDEHTQWSKPVCEHFIFKYHGGGVALIGTTRSRWWGGGAGGSNSAKLRNRFYKLLMNQTNNWDDDCFYIGPTMTWARYRYFRNFPKSNKRYDVTYMTMLTGDPEMNVWTDDPYEIDMIVDSIKKPGQDYYIVRPNLTYLDGGQAHNVVHAFVCLNSEDTYLINISNENGVCEFRVPNTTPSGKVTATKHNFVPAQGNFTKPK